MSSEKLFRCNYKSEGLNPECGFVINKFPISSVCFENSEIVESFDVSPDYESDLTCQKLEPRDQRQFPFLDFDFDSFVYFLEEKSDYDLSWDDAADYVKENNCKFTFKLAD